jgi:hypothetical protein
VGELELGWPLAEETGTGPDQDGPHALAHARAPGRPVVVMMRVRCPYVPGPSMFEEILMSGLSEGA